MLGRMEDDPLKMMRMAARGLSSAPSRRLMKMVATLTRAHIFRAAAYGKVMVKAVQAKL